MNEGNTVRAVVRVDSATSLAPAAATTTSPARVYLASLAATGRRSMLSALTQAADVLTQGQGNIDTKPEHGEA